MDESPAPILYANSVPGTTRNHLARYPDRADGPTVHFRDAQFILDVAGTAGLGRSHEQHRLISSALVARMADTPPRSFAIGIRVPSAPPGAVTKERVVSQPYHTQDICIRCWRLAEHLSGARLMRMGIMTRLVLQYRERVLLIRRGLDEYKEVETCRNTSILFPTATPLGS
jgi:hypothetical protein